MPNKTIISPAQGILLLIDHYRNVPNPDLTKVEQLKKYYLSGARTDEEQKAIKKLLQDHVLNQYEVSYTNDVINDDPTRRYFETHLAYETLRGQLHELSLDELQKHFIILSGLVPLNQFVHRVNLFISRDHSLLILFKFNSFASRIHAK